MLAMRILESKEGNGNGLLLLEGEGFVKVIFVNLLLFLMECVSGIE